MEKKMTVALAGNPNCGKTTVFNLLTGARQHVGNYPGVTVEKKEGTCTRGGIDMTIVDLPGTYSLTAHSADELVARNFVIAEKPDVVVNILDASNLERNLYLTTQLMELGVPLVLAFNMSDVARARGMDFDYELLSRHLGAPIVPMVGSKGEGVDELVAAVVRVAADGTGRQRVQLNFGPDVERELAAVADVLPQDTRGLDRRWAAVKLLEDDGDVSGLFTNTTVNAQVRKSREALVAVFNEEPDIIIAARRYGFISGACQEAVRSTVEARHDMSDRIDTVITNRLLGIPIFLFLMYGVFQLTFVLGGPPMEWIDAGFGWLGGVVDGWWPAGSDSILKSLIQDGIIGGVGGVVIFLPNIMLLFLAIAFLEDSGYMARGAFIIDRLMHKIGLHGKSFIPMIIGFGCSVPAIMATRTLENRRDRLVTMLVTPLMSCGARLPIYALIIPAFFPVRFHGTMLWGIYMIGIVLAVASAKVLNTFVFKGESAPFVMELPPYRMPTLKGLFIHMWERSWLYLKKAGTVILGISIVLWALTSFPKKDLPDVAPTGMTEEQAAGLENARQSEELAYTVAGRIGRFIEPVLKPLGFDWKIGTALIGAFAAKEVFVAQMGIVYSVGEADEESGDLRDRLRDNYTPLVAFCIMLFCLISAPCMATIAVTKRESGSWKWALFQLVGLTALAYVVTLAVYQVGRLFGG